MKIQRWSTPSKIQSYEEEVIARCDEDRYIEKQRDDFLNHISNLIEEFDKDPQLKTSKDKMELLAFCILTSIDGVDYALPGYKLIPITENENDPYTDVDIAGALHDIFMSKRRDTEEDND